MEDRFLRKNLVRDLPPVDFPLPRTMNRGELGSSPPPRTFSNPSFGKSRPRSWEKEIRLGSRAVSAAYDEISLLPYKTAISSST